MALPRHAAGSSTGRRSNPGGRRSWGRDRGRPVCRSSCVRTWGTPFSCLQPSTMRRDPLHITYSGRHGSCGSGQPARLDPHRNSRPAQASAAFAPAAMGRFWCMCNPPPSGRYRQVGCPPRPRCRCLAQRRGCTSPPPCGAETVTRYWLPEPARPVTDPPAPSWPTVSVQPFRVPVSPGAPLLTGKVQSRQTRLGQPAAEKHRTVSAGLVRQYGTHPEKTRKSLLAVARLQAGHSSRASLQADSQTPGSPLASMLAALT